MLKSRVKPIADENIFEGPAAGIRNFDTELHQFANGGRLGPDHIDAQSRLGNLRVHRLVGAQSIVADGLERIAASASRHGANIDLHRLRVFGIQIADRPLSALAIDLRGRIAADELEVGRQHIGDGDSPRNNVTRVTDFHAIHEHRIDSSGGRSKGLDRQTGRAPGDRRVALTHFRARCVTVGIGRPNHFDVDLRDSGLSRGGLQRRGAEAVVVGPHFDHTRVAGRENRRPVEHLIADDPADYGRFGGGTRQVRGQGVDLPRWNRDRIGERPLAVDPIDRGRLPTLRPRGSLGRNGRNVAGPFAGRTHADPTLALLLHNVIGHTRCATCQDFAAGRRRGDREVGAELL